MASISFLYRSSLDKAFLRLRFFYTLNGKKKFIEAPIKSEVTKEYWERYHNSNRIKDVTIRNFRTDLIQELDNIHSYVQDSSEGQSVDVFSKDWLLSIVNKYYQNKSGVLDSEEQSRLLVYWIDHYKLSKKNSVGPRTLEKADTVKSLIERFESAMGMKFNISEVDLKFKQLYENYCLDVGYAPNTIARNLSFIKTVCNYALLYGVELSPTLSLVKTKKEKVSSIYLSEGDIYLIENYNGLLDYLDNARDWLLISCYTGQRVSDFMRFNKSMVRFQKNKKGDLKPFIEFTQEKTQKLMSIPLSSKVVEILDKRSGDFPRMISDQKYNNYIKLVCKEVGLTEQVEGSGRKLCSDGKWRHEKGIYEKWELVSSHIGRRSFATNNYGKIPTVFLMSMTGHGSEKMFLTYIGKGSNDLTMELSEYFD